MVLGSPAKSDPLSPYLGRYCDAQARWERAAAHQRRVRAAKSSKTCAHIVSEACYRLALQPG